jgi:hypothetical protein
MERSLSVDRWFGRISGWTLGARVVAWTWPTDVGRRFSRTSARSCSGVIPKPANRADWPIPESSSNFGLLSAPAERITSPPARA